MGEKIKVLAKGKVQLTEFEVELNHPLSKSKQEQIHIQSDKFRLELDKNDFIKYALSVLSAEKNLKNLKGLE